MPTYCVTWDIDVEAASPEEAARMSAEIQIAPYYRPAFTVRSTDGSAVLIDLESLEPRDDDPTPDSAR